MPTYVYKCNECNQEIEVFEKSPQIRDVLYCNKCESETTHRLILKSGLLKFKGTGFYRNDYKDFNKYNKKSK